MKDDDEIDSELTPEERETLELQMLEEDLPCVRCSYNLRGLKPDGMCPECGARVRKSLNYATDRILCLACMHPNHPSSAICGNCRAPLNSASAGAGYFQTTPIGVRSKRSDDEEEKEEEVRKQPVKNRGPLRPHPVSVIFAWIACLPFAGLFGYKAVEIFLSSDSGFSWIFGAFALLFIIIGVRQTRKYYKQLNTFLKYKANMMKERAEGPADALEFVPHLDHELADDGDALETSEEGK
jgi:hypothetical protein